MKGKKIVKRVVLGVAIAIVAVFIGVCVIEIATINTKDEQGIVFGYTDLYGYSSPQLVVKGYEGKASEIVIPSKFKDDPVVGILKNAFADCSWLKRITFGDYLTEIRYDNAFPSSLESITVTEGNTKYSSLDGVLYDKARTKVVFTPQSISGKLSLPSTMTEVEGFYNKPYLTEVVIPDGVTSIGNSAFSRCSSLKKVTIPDSVTKIDTYAFQDCYSLNDIVIPKNVNYIGANAFSYCTSLTSLTIYAAPETIERNAFTLAHNLVEVYNKSSLQIEAGQDGYGGIARYAYDVYTGNEVSKLTTDENGFVIYNGKYSKKVLVRYVGEGTEIVVPETVTEIKDAALEYCTHLTGVTLPKGITRLGYDLFRGCGLRYCVIPSTVTEIAQGAFYDCTDFTSVYFGGTHEQWSIVAIDSNNNPLKNGALYCFSETNPFVGNGAATEGNYWHYDANGKITEW